MTDCDTKERKAIMTIWPAIVLLICLYHLSKAQLSKMSSCLGKGGSAQVVATRKTVREYLWGLLKRCV